MIALFEGVSGTSIAVWVIALLLAVGIAWTSYEKKKTRDKFLRELIAMDPARREKLLTRLRPDIQNDLRRQLMERGVADCFVSFSSRLFVVRVRFLQRLTVGFLWPLSAPVAFFESHIDAHHFHNSSS